MVLFKFFISTANNKYVHDKILPMTGSEPQTSRIRSDRSAKWVATTTQQIWFSIPTLKKTLFAQLLLEIAQIPNIKTETAFWAFGSMMYSPFTYLLQDLILDRIIAELRGNHQSQERYNKSMTQEYSLPRYDGHKAVRDVHFWCLHRDALLREVFCRLVRQRLPEWQRLLTLGEDHDGALQS